MAPAPSTSKRGSSWRDAAGTPAPPAGPKPLAPLPTMTITSFVLKNALRNKRRAVLSVMSVAVSLFLLVTLLVAVREFTLPPEDAGAAARVAVRNRISLANLLPARQLAASDFDSLNPISERTKRSVALNIAVVGPKKT